MNLGQVQAQANWVGSFFAAPHEEMSKEATELFLRFSLLERDDVERKSALWTASADDESIPRPLRMMMKHAEANKLNISKPVLAFLAFSGVIQTPGQISMYCAALKHRQYNGDGAPITMDYLGMNLFPSGFPTAEALDSLWDSFKEL